MAKKKLIVVKDVVTGDENLVNAANGKSAIGILVGERFESRTATNEDVVRLVNAGCKVIEEAEPAPPTPAPVGGVKFVNKAPEDKEKAPEDPYLAGIQQHSDADGGVPFETEATAKQAETPDLSL